MIDLSTIARMLDVSQTACLLPNLKHLVLHLPRGMPLCKYLLHPRLKHLHVVSSVLEEEPSDTLSIVRSLLSTPGGLVNLEIEYAVTFQILETLSRVTTLQHLRVEHTSLDAPLVLPGDFMKLLSSVSLPKLKTLIFRGVILYTHSPTSSSIPSYTFPSLESIEFELSGSSAKLYQFKVTVFDNNQFPSLRSVSFRYKQVERPHSGWTMAEAWRHLCEVYRFNPQVADCKIHASYRLLGSVEFSIGTFLQLAPQTLESLEVYGNFSEIVREGTELPSSKGPQTEIAFLAAPKTFVTPIRFQTLIDIAIGFPLLRRLNIHADLEDMPPINEIPSLDHPLEAITFSIPRDTDSDLAERCVARMFPRLLSKSIV